MFPKQLEQFYQGIENWAREMELIAGKSGRHMKYPYTFSAKIAQFPIFYYLKKNWIWTYYPFGGLIGLYCFAQIHAVVNSEESVRSWEESQRKMAEKEHH